MNYGLRYTVAINSVPYRFYPLLLQGANVHDPFNFTSKTSIINTIKVRSVFAVFSQFAVFAVFFAVRMFSLRLSSKVF